MRELNFCEVDLVSGGLGYMPNNPPPPPGGSCPTPGMDNADIDTASNVVQTIVAVAGLIWLIMQS